MSKNKGSVGKNVLLTFLRMSLLFIFFVIVRLSMPVYPNSALMFIQTLFLLSIIYYIQLIVHELGHLIFGKLTGYELILFRIDSLVLINKNNQIELKRYGTQNSGGQCLMSLEEDFSSNFPYLLYNLGGVIFNFFLSVLSIILYFNIKGKSILKAGLIGVGMLGLYLMVINGLPIKIGQAPNDGYNVRLLMGNELTKEAYYKQLRINKEIVNGKSYKKIDEKLFEIDTGSSDYNHLLLAMDILNMKRQMEIGLYKEAKASINNIKNKVEKLNQIQLEVFKGEELFLDILMGKDIIEIEKAHKENIDIYRNIANSNISMNRIMYAYELVVNEKVKESNYYLNRLNNIFKTYPFAGEIALEEELIKRVNELYLKNITEKYNA